jgi:phage terminase small subunit
MELVTVEEEHFCCEMVRGIDTSIAFRNSFKASIPMSPAQITKAATALMRKRHILARICEMRDAAARAAIMDGSKVIAEWMAIASADVNDLMQYQRVNCRHCHGANFEFQWINDVEYARSVAKAIDFKQPLPTNNGGYGFKENLAPNACCPNCAGEGIGRVHMQDSRYLSPEAKRLYAGVKQTRDGVEIKIRDQDAALLNLAKYFKLLAPEDKSDKEDGGTEIVITGGLPE